MTTTIDLARIGTLVGDPARAAILSVLMDGGVHRAKELAYAAGISPQTASFHFIRLAEGKLLVAERKGRNRHYRLASPLVARLLETMMNVAALDRSGHPAASARNEALRSARTCYDHFAGKLGVAIADALVSKGCVLLSADAATITDRGRTFIADFGIDAATIRTGRRAFCRPCLDWSERRPHLAGAFGAALTARCFDLGWVERMRDTRAVAVTEQGRSGFQQTFGLSL
jgi:DNA-binding transcriptional ArsR family regulator